MGHRWLSTDNGAQCFRCGLALDYMTESETGGNFAESIPNASEIAHGIAPSCTGPDTGRAHHFILEGYPHAHGGYMLACAYGDAQSTPDNLDPLYECIGA